MVNFNKPIFETLNNEYNEAVNSSDIRELRNFFSDEHSETYDKDFFDDPLNYYFFVNNREKEFINDLKKRNFSTEKEAEKLGAFYYGFFFCLINGRKNEILAIIERCVTEKKLPSIDKGEMLFMQIVLEVCAVIANAKYISRIFSLIQLFVMIKKKCFHKKLLFMSCTNEKTIYTFVDFDKDRSYIIGKAQTGEEEKIAIENIHPLYYK